MLNTRQLKKQSKYNLPQWNWTCFVWVDKIFEYIYFNCIIDCQCSTWHFLLQNSTTIQSFFEVKLTIISSPKKIEIKIG